MGEPDVRKSRVSIMKTQSHSKSLGNMSLSRMRLRRQSYGFSGAQSIRPTERTSQVAIEFKRPPLLYSPTFQLEPTSMFQVEKVTILVEDAITANFSNHKYSGTDSPALALRLASELMRDVKAMVFNRYRIISVVTVGHKRSQSYNNALAFLWDHERDNYVEAHRETPTAFIQVTLFGVYLD